MSYEVHGEILSKYNALGGAGGWGKLGYPLTDELPTPDGIGRFNHFEGGSIYWTPTTGAKMVHGAVRSKWAELGWERSWLGYPVQDMHWKQNPNPRNPWQEWCIFQNGAIFSLYDRAEPLYTDPPPPGASQATIAELPADTLTRIVRDTMDRAFHDADKDLGIEGGANIIRVGDWVWSNWACGTRPVTYAINGFHNNGLLQDSTFYIQLTLEFSLAIHGFGDPVDKTLIVSKIGEPFIFTQGIGAGELFQGLLNGINDKFKEPLAMRTITKDALLMDLIVTPQGGMQFLLEPDIDTPIVGNLRRLFFQRALDAL